MDQPNIGKRHHATSVIEVSAQSERSREPGSGVFGPEGQASAVIDRPYAAGTVVHADEEPHERFEVKRTDHQEACALDGACANGTGFVRRLRRAEIGIDPHLAGAYLLRLAQAGSGHQDHRRVTRDVIIILQK